LAELRRIYPGKADALTAETKGVAVDGLYVLRMQRYGSAENRSQRDAWHRDEGNDDAAIGHPVHSSSPQPIERRAGVVGLTAACSAASCDVMFIWSLGRRFGL
jgi:hypothetical protein